MYTYPPRIPQVVLDALTALTPVYGTMVGKQLDTMAPDRVFEQHKAGLLDLAQSLDTPIVYNVSHTNYFSCTLRLVLHRFGMSAWAITKDRIWLLGAFAQPQGVHVLMERTTVANRHTGQFPAPVPTQGLAHAVPWGLYRDVADTARGLPVWAPMVLSNRGSAHEQLAFQRLLARPTGLGRMLSYRLGACRDIDTKIAFVRTQQAYVVFAEQSVPHRIGGRRVSLLPELVWFGVIPQDLT